MKYGLITIHDTNNYGSLLQAYSTYKAIRFLGVDVSLIDYHNNLITKRETVVFSGGLGSIKDIVKKLKWGKAQQEKYENIHNFLKSNTVMSPVYDIANIKEANKLYDGFISGSDIVWGTNITGADMTYFLDFAEDDKRKLSFSASVGTEWTEKEKSFIGPLLTRYDSISVREQLAAGWIENLIGKIPSVTCDPTMLFSRSDWEKYIIPGYAPKDKYVLIYAVNPDKKNITDGIEYAKRNNMVAYFINFYSHVKGTKTIHPMTVNQWISLFANADAVFSASYHGLLFSLYFRRNVFFYNRGEKSRMISLSKELGIEHREGIDENLKNIMPIDFDHVDEVMEQKRKNSWNYLRQAFYEDK